MCIVALTGALGDILREGPRREKYKSIHILCGNSVFANSLPKARSSPLDQWMTRRLLMFINELSDTAVVIHYFSKDLGKKINSSSYLNGTHTSFEVTIRGEELRMAAYERNTDIVASFVYGINQRLPTREHMRHFRGFRKVFSN